MNKPDLLPCPFCGGNVRLQLCDDEGNFREDDYLNDPWSGVSYALTHVYPDVMRQDCPITHDDGEMVGAWLYDTPEEAELFWNQRVVKSCAAVKGNPGGWFCGACGRSLLLYADYCAGCGTRNVKEGVPS